MATMLRLVAAGGWMLVRPCLDERLLALLLTGFFSSTAGSLLRLASCGFLCLAASFLLLLALHFALAFSGLA